METQTPSRSLRQRLRARPVLTGGLGLALLTVLAVVVFWFEPQALFIDDVVDEEFPSVEPAEADDAAATTEETSGSDTGASEAVDGTESEDAGETAAPEEPAGPVALASGDFEGRNDYAVAGEATVHELPDGSRTLRFENFEADNGPDLHVYLTSASSADPDAVIDQDIVDLGVLTGNIGNQNYTIPADVDLERYDTVLIWCLRFTAGFGTADLVAP